MLVCLVSVSLSPALPCYQCVYVFHICFCTNTRYCLSVALTPVCTNILSALDCYIANVPELHYYIPMNQQCLSVTIV